MSKTRKKKRKKTNILLGFVCILLAVLLGFILVTNYKTEQEESKHLSEIAGAQQNGIEDYEAVKKHAEELEKTAPEDTEDTDDSKSKNVSPSVISATTTRQRFGFPSAGNCMRNMNIRMRLSAFRMCLP